MPTSISPLFNHFQIRKAEIASVPCYTGSVGAVSCTVPPARSTACPGATQRECTTGLRHKSLRDHRKPQKKNVLTLYDKFARISQFASPTAARCSPAGTPPALRPALGCTAHARNLFDWRPLRRQFPHFHVARPSGALPPRRESG